MVNESTGWQEEADVVVVGYGGAGATAAITAHDAGVRTLLLEKEKQDLPNKTNHTPSTRMAGGGWFCPTDGEQARLYLEALVKSANEFLDDERKKVIGALANALCGNTDFTKSIGIEPHEEPLKAEFPDLPGAECCAMYVSKPVGLFHNGAAIFKFLSEAVAKRNIPVMWETPAAHLVYENGEVRGVVARRDGRDIRIKASRAVIMTTGGFEYDEWMKQNYLKAYPAYFTGNPGNTGDGLKMTMEIGAKMWHMNSASWRVTYKFPENPVAFGTQQHEDGTVIIDKRGVRFANERFKMHSFGYELTNYDGYAHCYPRIPCFLIFDEKRRKLAPMAGYHGNCNPPGGVMGDFHYIWDKDNQKEIDRGWITKASTLDELGRKLLADPDDNGLLNQLTFKETIKRYNDFCHKGEDLDFGKPKQFLKPIEDPPYYAIKLWPGGPNTQGGPMRNENGQVIRVDGSPIPRLYTAGELGSIWGLLYQVGGNIGECLAFGRVTGSNAAAQKAWE